MTDRSGAATGRRVVKCVGRRMDQGADHGKGARGAHFSVCVSRRLGHILKGGMGVEKLFTGKRRPWGSPHFSTRGNAESFFVGCFNDQGESMDGVRPESLNLGGMPCEAVSANPRRSGKPRARLED